MKLIKKIKECDIDRMYEAGETFMFEGRLIKVEKFTSKNVCGDCFLIVK